MLNSDQGNQDQRKNSGMEDSTKTIYYLRARLLSERSVSRSARQRADELAKRVVELEEQLKIVSLQRKMAEKATADVLAILEDQGISDISDEYDLSSDQEIPCESNLDNTSTKNKESSINSKVRRNESEDLSGSDLDSSPTPGRSLSWKGRNDSSRSLQKHKDSSMRRQSSFPSTSCSPKHRLGRSCRQFRHKETGSLLEEFKTEPFKVVSQENGVATSSKGFPNGSDDGLKGGSEIQEEKVLLEDTLSGCLANHRNEGNNDLDYNEYRGDKDMEKALEDQAQLIGQNKAMEKDQREWEEKFRENNNSTPDSCDHGNHSDISEERDVIKTQAPYTAPAVAPCAQEVASQATSDVANVCFSKELSKTELNGVLPPSRVDTGGLQEKTESAFTSESASPEFAFPMTKGKQNQVSPETYDHQPSHSSHREPHSRGSPGNQSALSSSSDVGSSFRKGYASGSRNDLYALVPHEPSNSLGGVLEALKQARVSLEQKMNRLPLVEDASVGKAIEPSVPAIRNGDRIEIPVGCAGLFRLPADYAVEATTQASFPGSGSRSTSAYYYPDRGVALPAGDRFAISPYMETRSGFPTLDRHLSSRYETMSRVPSQRPSFDPYLDTVLSSSSRYTNNPSYSTYSTYASHPESMPRMPSNEGFSRTFPSSNGVPADNLFYDDYIRPNMFR